MVLPLGKIALAIQGAKAVKGMLPDSFFVEMKKYVETTVQSAIGKMNLVTREEVEEQEKQLLQLRKKIETMEQLVTKLQEQKQTVGKRQ